MKMFMLVVVSLVSLGANAYDLKFGDPNAFKVARVTFKKDIVLANGPIADKVLVNSSDLHCQLSALLSGPKAQKKGRMVRAGTLSDVEFIQRRGHSDNKMITIALPTILSPAPGIVVQTTYLTCFGTWSSEQDLFAQLEQLADINLELQK
ncbi:MAG: hypothetical protein V4692_00945 [Bdellovibrionota bacterium]